MMEVHETMSDVSSRDSSFANLPSDSPGSSVSTRLKDEYDELLKYAVVVPTYDPMSMPKSLADFRGSFPLGMLQRVEATANGENEGDDSGTEVGEGEGMLQGREVIPDGGPRPQQFSQSTPIRGKTSISKTNPPVSTELHERPCLNPDARVEDSDDATQHIPPPNTDPDSPRSQVSSIQCCDREDYSAYGFSMTVDQDVARMEGLMATWLGDLNRNVLAEFGQSKIRMLEYYKQQLQKEKERHAAENNRIQNEMEGLKELLLTYEQSIERKDEVIANLTRAMQKQRDKFEMAKTFCEWKIRHNDSKREAFASNMAYRHYQRTLAQKVWDAWHSLVESRWRQRVEKACQAKAQEVCMQLTNDYETRLASLNEALEDARTEVTRLHAERDRYEETMKKAFMRGVCALNLEAMTMFHEGDDPKAGESGAAGVPAMPGGGTDNGSSSDHERLGLPQTYQQEPVFTTEPPGAPSPRIVTSQGASSSRSTISQASSRSGTSVSSRTKAGQKGKVISAKLSARSDTSSKSSLSGNIPMGLAPPMSSVIVERHQPVTKATIGKATASQYPRTAPGMPDQATGGLIQRKIAGQHRQVPLSTPNIQTIKMVE